MAEEVLAGARVLVVEDEALIAMLLEDMLDSLGCAVVGPAGTLADALQLAATGEFDCALLDVNLRGEPAYPVAEALLVRRLPFVFVTGYGQGALGERFAGRPTLTKPFDMQRLQAALCQLLDERAPPGGGPAA